MLSDFGPQNYALKSESFFQLINKTYTYAKVQIQVHQTNSMVVSLKIKEGSLRLSQAVGLNQRAVTGFTNPVRCCASMDRELF